jgi:hypothetical protein
MNLHQLKFRLLCNHASHLQVFSRDPDLSLRSYGENIAVKMTVAQLGFLE